MAAVQPTRLETAGKVRVDPYYWLAKRDDPAVLQYLRAENEYADAVMEPLAPLESEIYAEIKGRIEKDDSTVPVRRGDHFYYARFEGDGEYPLFARKRGIARRAGRVAGGRQRSGARPLVLLDLGCRGELEREAARVRHRHRRPADLHAAVQGPRARPHAPRRDPGRDRQPCLGRGRPHDLLLQAGARDAALVPGLSSRRRQRSEQGRAGVRGDRSGVRVLGGQDALAALSRDRVLADPLDRDPLPRSHAAQRRVPRPPCPRAEPRVPRRSPGRLVLHPHQLERAQLPADARGGRADRQGGVAGGRCGAAGRLPRGLHGVSRPPRARGAPRGPDPSPRSGRGTTASRPRRRPPSTRSSSTSRPTPQASATTPRWTPSRFASTTAR